MKDKGGNKYKIPHVHKDRRWNDGSEIIGLSCDAQLFTETKAIIKER